jgi:AAA domain
VGKSSLELVEAVAMAAEKCLLGDRLIGKLRVWYVNGEDPLEEIERRIAAICLQHGITREDLSDSGRDNEILLAQDSRDGVQVATAKIAELRRAITENQIDVIILDPFVAFHAVSENDNRAINAVCRQLAMLAEEANCAIEVVHHTRKAGPKQTEHAAEDARGASALLAAVRSERILNRMTREDAERAGVRDPWAYFRVDSGKANLAPAGGATWRRLVDRALDNGREGVPGDRVGVVVAWQWPDRAGALTDGDIRAVQDVIAGGQWRSNAQAGDWAGRAVAEALDFDASEKMGRARAKEILAALTVAGCLKVVHAPDKNGDQRPFVRVGKLNYVRKSQLTDDETGLEAAYKW